MECDEAGTQVDDEENNRDSGWITVTRRRSEVKKAGGALGAQTPASKPTAEAPTPGCHGFGDIKKNIIRASKMPPLPRDETKIIVRPRGGLCISKVGPSVEAEAIWEAAGLDPGERNSDTMCPNPLQNIMVVSTPSQENVKHYVNVEAITVAGQDHEVSAYVAAPHATCKGVIRGIPLSDGREAIDRKIVNARNPLALGAKRIKSTGVVIVLFDGYKVPNYVSYGGTLIKCTLYRKQVDVCYACGRLGHRSDVCPTPDASVCRACREAIQPNEHHVCEPICSLCGGKHLTASRDCKHRYQTPYVRQAQARPEGPRHPGEVPILRCGRLHRAQRLSSPGPARTIGNWRPIQVAREIENQRRQQEPLHIQGASKVPFEIRGTLQVQDTVRIPGPFRVQFQA
ncbi:hypothetical protein HPB52_002616 [Rhipicephalus sanguineus]|uniref:CCHC-type domain-containing protein n=1 Tax=Rhipicephalus sanguineus TaxID=34632 RepID=A0A9D4T6R2_RHISA|nr:hypothetical protein HPB52_002616 [Rhipicephalus sanguineus]